MFRHPVLRQLALELLRAWIPRFAPRIAAAAMYAGGYSSTTNRCASCALPVYILVGDRDFLLDIARKARTWFLGCGSEVVFDVMPGVRHRDVGKALRKGKEQVSTDGIRKHTRATSNERIDRETQASLDQVGDEPARIEARLAELDREWDVDRALMLNFAVLGGLSAGMTMRNLHARRELGGWGGLFITQMAFLAHHAIRRWCPPLPVFRRLGFRSAREINAERVELLKRLEDRRGTTR